MVIVLIPHVHPDWDDRSTDRAYGSEKATTFPPTVLL